MQKKLPTISQWKAIVYNFCRGCQYEQLAGQEGLQFSANKSNLKKPLERGGARG